MLEGEWMPLSQYCTITGERPNSVNARISRGDWQRGVHASTPDGGVTFINIPAVLVWIHPSNFKL